MIERYSGAPEDIGRVGRLYERGINQRGVRVRVLNSET